MIPIPENVRDVLFRFNWDKVLVDVRRTITIAQRGKQEVYTAMVAVGNHEVLDNPVSLLGYVLAALSLPNMCRAHIDNPFSVFV